MYAQGVLGASAIQSGLLLVPLNFTWLTASILVGHRIALTGGYKRFPVCGAVASVIGVLLLVHVVGNQTGSPIVLGVVGP